MNASKNIPVVGARRRPRFLIMVAVISYLLFMIINTPVAWLWPPLPQNLPLKLSGLHGTIWSGSADFVSVQYGHRFASLPELHWKVHPWELLSGRVGLDVEMGMVNDPLQINGHLTVSPRSVTFSNTDIDVDAVWITSNLGIQLPFQLESSIYAQLKRVSVGFQGQCRRADAEVDFGSTRIESPFANIDLGTITANTVCEDGTLRASINQQSAQLEAKGSFAFQPSGQYSLNGTINATANTPEPVKQGLSMMAKLINPTSWELIYNGSL